ncbi:hypothetical protein GCM10028805_24740 [Spirosoma harenae]
MLHILHAGSVHVQYENGFLRYITVDESEIVRMIYFAIRDHNWSTASIKITNESIVQKADSFQIDYQWETDDLGIRMVGQVVIIGDETGTISVDWYGEALNTFRKNRVGLCILHPIDGVLGQPAQLVSPDGKTTDSHFPTFISPHQPFLNVQAMRWQSASGPTWQLDFSGEVFETEDQRNWTDASFKTYSTPVDLPKPVSVSTGDEFRQRVVFRRAEEALTVSADKEKMQEMDQVRSAFGSTRPRVGVGQRVGGEPLTDTEADLLHQLNLSHLRADVFFNLPNWQDLLTNAIADAHKLTVPLELAVFFGENPATELETLTQFLQEHPVAIQSMSLFNAASLRTSNELLHALVPTVRANWPEAAIGGGTDDNFAELNRNPFDFDLVDFVTYSASPQVHAFDNLTLLENIVGQAETVITAKHLTGGKPIHISPVTLRLRYITITNTATERLNSPTDPRQTTEFGADWTRQSLEALANAGTESITYYQSHGPLGLVDGDKAYPLFTAFANR